MDWKDIAANGENLKNDDLNGSCKQRTFIINTLLFKNKFVANLFSIEKKRYILKHDNFMMLNSKSISIISYYGIYYTYLSQYNMYSK